MRRKALIVTEMRELYHEITNGLQTAALEIDHAEAYAQAVSLYARFHYVLVILDLGIPDADGVTIVRRFRQLEQTPILVLSTCYSKKEEIEVLNAGADTYLPVEGPLDPRTASGPCLGSDAAISKRQYQRIRRNSDWWHWTENQSEPAEGFPEWRKSSPDSVAVFDPGLLG